MRIALIFLIGFAAYGQDWKLGSAQFSGNVGFNVSENRSLGARPSVGASFEVGLAQFLSVTTGYDYHHVAGEKDIGYPDSRIWVGGTPVEVRARGAMHDWVVGPRLQMPLGRVTPYVQGLAGGTWITRYVRVGSYAPDPIVELHRAFGGGGGLEVRVSRYVSFLVDARALRPRDLPWHGRVGFGFAYRWHRE